MPILNSQYESLDPSFQPVVLAILTELEKKGWQPYVAEGRRTLEQQQEKVAAGNSQTMHSYHLTGLAADIVDKRYGWDIPRVHQFWWDYFQIASHVQVPVGHRVRCGIIWDHPERIAIYKQTLDDLEAKKITVKEAEDKINWFADVAHCELR